LWWFWTDFFSFVFPIQHLPEISDCHVAMIPNHGSSSFNQKGESASGFCWEFRRVFAGSSRWHQLCIMLYHVLMGKP
jgi:hypothetical protein